MGVKENHLLGVAYFFTRYGGGIMITARFFEILRQLNGIVAGSLAMPWRRFLLFNMLGAGLWVGFWGGGMFLLGRYFTKIEQALRATSPYVIVIGLLVLLSLGGYLFNSRSLSQPKSKPEKKTMTTSPSSHPSSTQRQNSRDLNVDDPSRLSNDSKNRYSSH